MSWLPSAPTLPMKSQPTRVKDSSPVWVASMVIAPAEKPCLCWLPLKSEISTITTEPVWMCKAPPTPDWAMLSLNVQAEKLTLDRSVLTAEPPPPADTAFCSNSQSVKWAIDFNTVTAPPAKVASGMRFWLNFTPRTSTFEP